MSDTFLQVLIPVLKLGNLDFKVRLFLQLLVNILLNYCDHFRIAIAAATTLRRVIG